MKHAVCAVVCLLLTVLLAGCSFDPIGKKLAEFSLAAVRDGRFTSEQLALPDTIDEPYREAVTALLRSAASKLEYEVKSSRSEKGESGTEHHVSVSICAVDCHDILLDTEIYRSALKNVLEDLSSFSDLPSLRERVVLESLKLLQERIEGSSPTLSSDVVMIFAKVDGSWTVTNGKELIPAFTGIDPDTLLQDILSAVSDDLASAAENMFLP